MVDGLDVEMELVVLRDEPTGLEGVIALHSTALGPAAGGCRMAFYPRFADCVEDASRLARGMTFKNAMAGLPLGGGKAVLRLPSEPFERAALFEAFGRAVEGLRGRYLTAEDVGTTVSDMARIARATRHVAGLPKIDGRPGGDPSPWTARGVFVSMESAARRTLDKDLSELTIAIQGVGSVGAALAMQLHQAGARLVLADVCSERVARVAAATGAFVVSIGDILAVDADVFAPCALGGTLNDRTVDLLRAKLVCGAANNQLASPDIGARLHRRGVTYCPDYVVNSGGIINVAGEHLGWDEAEVLSRVERTRDRLAAVLDHAERLGASPGEAADELARAALAAAGSLRLAA